MAPVFIRRYGQIKGSTYLYGFKIDQTGDVPVIEYIEDNKNYTPVSIVLGTLNNPYNTFSYGSWKGAHFLQVSPCVLGFDGKVICYLDENDYTKNKKTGETVNIESPDLAGNVMIEFPKTYYKLLDNGDNTANVYISNRRLDEDFVYWPFMDENGDTIPYCYMSAYHCTSLNSKLRSLSNKDVRLNNTLATNIANAKRNGTAGNENIWNIGLFCDKVLLTLYGMLLGRTVDVQSVFGQGKTCCSSGTTAQKKTYFTEGSLGNQKGLFASLNNDMPDSTQDRRGMLKYFGIENFWGLSNEMIAGIAKCYNRDLQIVNPSGQTVSGCKAYYVKMTYGTGDGSSIVGYGSTLDELLKYVPVLKWADVISGYVNRTGVISKMIFDKNAGLLPKEIIADNTDGSTGLGYGGDLQKVYSVNYTICVGGDSYTYASGHYGKWAGLFNMNGVEIGKTYASGDNMCCGLSCKPKAA